MYKKYIKRLIDIILSFIGIAVLSWLFIIIALLIKIDSKGTIFFKQKRIGIHKSTFNMLKFRSMRTDAPHNMPTHMLNNVDTHITRVGKVIRKLSLDELPQFFNIFMGNMSIIGPRPALWNQNDLIEERDKYGANDVKPGLTGWAQINGRDELPVEVKAKFDGDYVKMLDEFGFMADWKCFWKTVIAVIKSEGVVEGKTVNARISGDSKSEVIRK